VSAAGAICIACFYELAPLIMRSLTERDRISVVDRNRRAVERYVPEGEMVYLYRNDMQSRPSQIFRSIFLSTAWATGAGRLKETRHLNGEERYVLTGPTFSRPDSLVGDCRYVELKSDSATGPLWVREDAPVRLAQAKIVISQWREMAGLMIPVLIALVLFWWGVRRIPDKMVFAASCIVFMVVAIVSMSHHISGVCGLGVFGGRARMLVERGWDFTSLADASAGEYFQSAYPPLFAVITALEFMVTGGFGERLVQLSSPLFWTVSFAVLACALREEGERGTVPLVLLLCAMLVRPIVVAVGNFYAEPLLLLLLGCGWVRLRRNDALGWLSIALTGLVKNEGLLYLLAMVVWQMVRKKRMCLSRKEFVLIGIGLMPVCAWHLGCRYLGARLYDYAMPWDPSISHGLLAALTIIEELFMHPWRCPFLVTLGCVFVIVVVASRHMNIVTDAKIGLRDVFPSVVLFLTFVTALCYVFALSRAPDFRWHVSSVPRLLVPIGILALCDMICSCRSLWRYGKAYSRCRSTHPCKGPQADFD